MSVPSHEITALLLATIGALVIPVVGMRMIVPSLESSGRVVPNYRGRPVFFGLGLVWVFWVLGVTLMAVVQTLCAGGTPCFLTATGPTLVLWTFVFGLIDDVFGTSHEKGFRGHLRSLSHGRLTTGGLKLIGIGLVSLAAAAGTVAARSNAAGDSLFTARVGLGIVAGAVVIAGSANLLNLLDLRPGRALKSYLFVGAVCLVAALVSAMRLVPGLTTLVSTARLGVYGLGPAIAVWRYDLRERGMLGDAGANPAGALVGFALVELLPLWGVVAVAVGVVALNLASERVSFSQFIAQNRLLAWLDGLGRVPTDPALLDESVPDMSPRNTRHDG